VDRCFKISFPQHVKISDQQENAMADASTEDCKKFIQDNAAALGIPESGWKRASKSKGADGWLRVFEHASGASLRLVEPFGQGAAGLRVEAPTPAAALDEAAFESASEPMKAAMLWRDAMRAIGGKAPTHTKGPSAHGWSWGDFVKANKDFSGGSGRDQAQELTQEWVDLGMAEPAAKALLLDGVSWCFDSDAEYGDAEGCWEAGEGARIAVWPTDAPDEFEGDLANPVYSTDLENSSESVFMAGQAAASGREAFIKAWEEMKVMGCHFDMATQKDFNQNGDCDEKDPIDKKIKRIIPELIAREEARKLAKVAGAGSKPSAKRSGI
jgi:hypothetical protein